MKNSADLEGYYPPRPLASVDNTLLDLQNSSYPTQPIIANYYSFKIFPRFWLVKTTRIIQHNQLLFTTFAKNLRHIESMTSKVEPSENYLTIDVKMTSKVQPAADYWTVDPENLGTRAKWRNAKNGKYFEWIIKQLLNSAFVGYEKFCRSRRVLSTLPSVSVVNTLLDLQISSYPTQPRSIIAKCLFTGIKT